MKLEGFLVKSDEGQYLARIYGDTTGYRLVRFPSCSLGLYFYILTWLRDQNIDIR